MSRRDDVLLKHREAIRQVTARREPDSIALVGLVARGDDGADSDYDFLARFAEGASLFDLVGRQLDLEEHWPPRALTPLDLLDYP